MRKKGEAIDNKYQNTERIFIIGQETDESRRKNNRNKGKNRQTCKGAKVKDRTFGDMICVNDQQRLSGRPKNLSD